MSSDLVLVLLLVVLLCAMSYIIGKRDEKMAYETKLEKAQQRNNLLTGELKLMWEIVDKCAEEDFPSPVVVKACDMCMDLKPLTQYHSHPTCKCCRKSEDAARYQAKKEVAQ